MKVTELHPILNKKNRAKQIPEDYFLVVSNSNPSIIFKPKRYGDSHGLLVMTHMAYQKYLPKLSRDELECHQVMGISPILLAELGYEFEDVLFEEDIVSGDHEYR